MARSKSLTATVVPVRLASGKMSSAVRHKNLNVVPTSSGPSAGPATVQADSTGAALGVKPAVVVTHPWEDDTDLSVDSEFHALTERGLAVDLESGAVYEFADDSDTGSGWSPSEGRVQKFPWPGPLSAETKESIFDEIRDALDRKLQGEGTEDDDRFIEEAMAGGKDASERRYQEQWNVQNEALSDALSAEAESLTTAETVVTSDWDFMVDSEFMEFTDVRTGLQVRKFFDLDDDPYGTEGMDELAALVAEHDAEEADEDEDEDEEADDDDDDD